VRRRRWPFVPRGPALLGLLLEQAQITLEGLEAFRDWSSGHEARAQAVSEAEHRADEARERFENALWEAFITPLRPEDLYELSERTDEILNAAKNTVREAEVMAMAPDAAMAEMSERLYRAMEHLVAAFGALGPVTDKASVIARSSKAIGEQRSLERSYRSAMSGLLRLGDLAEVMGRRELYRRYARLGDAVVRVAERIRYALVKQI
jgi:uncharacterized protein